MNLCRESWETLKAQTPPAPTPQIICLRNVHDFKQVSSLGVGLASHVWSAMIQLHNTVLCGLIVLVAMLFSESFVRSSRFFHMQE